MLPDTTRNYQMLEDGGRCYSGSYAKGDISDCVKAVGKTERLVIVRNVASIQKRTVSDLLRMMVDISVKFGMIAIFERNDSASKVWNCR